MKRRPLLDRFWERVCRGSSDECWLWAGSRTKAGYGNIGGGGRRGPSRYAHRISWELENGPIPDGLHVCHRCDNPPCVNPAHMFLGTPADNARDKVSKGRHPRGERQPTAKLTSHGVELIRGLYDAGGVSQYLLAELFGVSRGCVQRIIQRSTWAEVA